MTMFLPRANPSHHELPSTRERQRDLSGERETVHELMNQLTTINLCTSQLRSSFNPVALSTLELAIENAIRTARLLATEMSH